MPRPHSFRLVQASLLLTVLMAGPTACSPSVSDMELNQAKSRQEQTAKEQAKAEQELKALNEEVRALRGGFTGPQHGERVKKAESLKQEKAELESIKADVDEKLAQFTADTKRHREALAKAKP